MSPIPALAPLPAPAAADSIPAPRIELGDWVACTRHDAGVAVTALRLSGLHCAACAGTIERALERLPGVHEVRVAAAAGRATLRWDPDASQPAQWLAALRAIGYDAAPDGSAGARQLRDREWRAALWRCFVGAFCAMQIMMLAAPAYVASPGDLSPELRALLEWASWVLVLPVMGFAVGPLAASAWRALRQRRLSMDVPVVLGIGVMFVASSIAMSGGDPAREVYFDSLAMFVAFLWGGRLLQLRLRHRAAEALENVAAALPQTALRVGEDGHVQRLPREELRRGDRVRVPRGAAVPADGCLLDERAELSEALLNGESRPAGKRRGDTVLAAAINRGPSFDLRVERIGADTRVAGIAALMQQTLSERPQHLGAADRIAGPFLAGVIVLAALAAAVWSWIEPSRAIGAAVAVLIATCPCALALASPATLAAGAAGLARRGLLPLRLRLFDRLLQVDRVFIDKTGTLTTDRPAWTATRLHTPVPPVLTEAAALHWAASMARSSLHPLAQALSDAAGDEGPPMPWAHLEETPGAGLQAMDAEGRRWRLGATDWADDSAVMADDAPRVVLACDGRRVASFEFDEALRPGAREAIAALQHAGLTLILLSGDRPARAQRLASRLGIGEVIAPASPEAKLAALKSAQARGHRVAMIGDGLNDAPVLAAADVAIAMGQGALLAQQAADGVVIGGRLDAIVQARSGVARSLRIQRQNLAWALAYNAACVPLAALGALPAWAAGIGMAASSVLVLLNAQRAANHA